MVATMVPELFTVTRNEQETHDIFTLVLEPISGKRCVFNPGQFNMLYLPGVGEVAISIAGDPANAAALVHTIRLRGEVTHALSRLHAGDQIGVRGPFGSGWPMPALKGQDVIVMAGGIALPPLQGVLYQLAQHPDQYGHTTLLYGARTPADLVYRPLLERWQQHSSMELHLTVDQQDGQWQGAVGVVPALLDKVSKVQGETRALLCGPEPMMQAGILQLLQRGCQASNIYLSLERNMKCAIGQCGHCQWGHNLLCREGPVFCYESISHLLPVEGL